MARVMRTYHERWRYRHPSSDDFYAVASEVSGRDLTWFFTQLTEGSGVIDFEVASLTSRRESPVAGLVDTAGGKTRLIAPEADPAAPNAGSVQQPRRDPAVSAPLRSRWRSCCATRGRAGAGDLGRPGHVEGADAERTAPAAARPKSTRSIASRSRCPGSTRRGASIPSARVAAAWSARWMFSGAKPAGGSRAMSPLTPRPARSTR